MSKAYFLDTSALVKLYHEEEGTKTLDDLICTEKPTIVISDLAVIEMTSALLKKVRMHIIDHEVCSQAIASFENDLLQFTVSVLHASQTSQCDLFIVTDTILAEIVAQKGLNVLNLSHP